MPASRLLNRFTQNVSIIEFTIPFEPVLPDPGPCQIMLAITLLECSQVEATLVDKPEAPDRFDISIGMYRSATPSPAAKVQVSRFAAVAEARLAVRVIRLQR